MACLKLVGMPRKLGWLLCFEHVFGPSVCSTLLDRRASCAFTVLSTFLCSPEAIAFRRRYSGDYLPYNMVYGPPYNRKLKDP